MQKKPRNVGICQYGASRRNDKQAKQQTDQRSQKQQRNGFAQQVTGDQGRPAGTQVSGNLSEHTSLHLTTTWWATNRFDPILGGYQRIVKQERVCKIARRICNYREFVKGEEPLARAMINIRLILVPSLAIYDFPLKIERQANNKFVHLTRYLTFAPNGLGDCRFDWLINPAKEEKIVRLSVSFLSVLVISAACLASDFSELTVKVPQGANAVMAIDVTKTLATPLAKKNGWDSKLTDGGSDRPLYLPPEADKLLSAAQIDITRNFTKSWNVSLFGLTESIPIGVVARLEGGNVDKIEDVDVAWLPSDAYVMKIGETTLIMQSPANRQAAARWIDSQKNSQAMGISDYLGVALAAMNRAPHIVMALDASNAIQRHRVEQQLQQSGFLEKHSLDMEQVAGLIAGLQGTVLEITFT